MQAVFLRILNMSIAAGWLIAVVLILRLLLKKAPKWITCVLWAFVAVRLACPFSFETVFSLIPSAETVSPDIVYSASPAIDSGMPLIDNALNPVIGQVFAPEPLVSANPLQIWLPVACILWLAGILSMAGYALISYGRLCRRLKAAIPLRDNIRICDEIQTPFILGIIRPRIYLPSGTAEEEEKYILAHEKAHLKRRDYWWKPLGFALLTIHWFNPLVWIAYSLLCRDIELACDEKVIRDYGLEDRKAYSQALLVCSISSGRGMACPLQFGEVGVKERVKSVLSYRKPGFWIILAAVLACGATAVCFLTNPKGDEGETASPKTEVYGVIMELEGEPGRLVLEIPYTGTVEIPEAGKIYPYYDPEEDGLGLTITGQLVKLVFPGNTELTLQETYPARFVEAAEEIVVMSSGDFYLRQDGAVGCVLGFPAAWLADGVDTEAGDTLNIYREPKESGLLAQAAVLSVDREAEVPMIYIALSAEDARRFLEEWGSSLGTALFYETEKSVITEGTDAQEETGAQEQRSDSGEPEAETGVGLITQGQFHGYIAELGDNYVLVDEQLWITSEDEEWKSEYDDAAGFAVVDVRPENGEYVLDEGCTYEILENHWQPGLELTKEAFAEYLKENEDYPVLWIFTVKDGVITGIQEQYRP